MTWCGAHGRLGPWRRVRRAAARDTAIPLLVLVAGASLVATSSASYAAAAPSHTKSYYERNANTGVLYRQGEEAGKAAAQGIVILDFGRPAVDGSDYGTLGFGNVLIPLASIAISVESYISAYYRYAPMYTMLNVAVGTNNSCGPGQPCGKAICGCPEEPRDFVAWGEQLALTVEEVGAWTSAFRARNGFTDDVRVVAADDAEPAFDPEYSNTFNLLKGYAAAVGGYFPPLVDFGSAESHVWTEGQLLQVAYGFRPDVPMPEIYYPADASEWAALLRYAKARSGRSMEIYGVLSGGRGTSTPASAASDMLHAITQVTGQRSIPWLSTITR